MIVLAFIGVSVAAYVASASPVIQLPAETALSTTGVGSTITNTDSALMLETVLKDAGPLGHHHRRGHRRHRRAHRGLAGPRG